MHDKYFEGILQLRNHNKEIADFIRYEAAKESQIISKEEKVSNGIDFYFVSKKYLRTLGYKLQRTFSGELKSSARLHTRNRQTSKEVYRLHILFRVSNFKKGDSVGYKGEKITIINAGKKIFAKKEDGTKITLRYGDLS